jgi:hypothetical protein
MIIDTARVLSDALHHCAADALLFTLMDDAFNEKGCRRGVFAGSVPHDPDLTQPKHAHGFRCREFRVYWSVAARMLRIGVRMPERGRR